ncbi:MAG: ion transporter [Oscillospiraceae bacterium]|nr:ion transporter [Oscillospiraceae bacterium]
MRKRIFEIIEVSKDGDKLSLYYDTFMLFTIIISIVPLAFKDTNTVFQIIDIVTVSIFILDYLARFITADLKLDKGARSFLIYPFTIWAIIDLISILPSLSALGSGFKLFKLFRIFRTLRVFRTARVFRTLRVAKAMRYSKSFTIIAKVIKNSKEALVAVITLAFGYILVSALIIFNVEPDSFNTFFDAIYWATVSLTTVGYGDIYPVSTAGRIITMISSLFGIAIVALPAGIITAGYMSALEEEHEDKSLPDKVDATEK